MTRIEAIEYLELARVLFIDDDSGVYHNEIWEALGLAIDALSYEVAYICDESYCSPCDNPDCHHTCDIYHAKNFVQLEDGKWIENGVTLPTFKVGDVVWVYDFMWGIIPCEIDRPYHCRCGKEGGCTFEMNFEEADVGKYVFATREEAEHMWPW